MAVSALATSWSGYQSSVWNSKQVQYQTAASNLRMCASRTTALAGQRRIIDVIAFLGWLNARTANQTDLARFYEERFSPDFARAFRSWYEMGPFEKPAPQVPFILPEYRLAAERRAANCEREAEHASKDAQRANGVSDGYMFGTVIFALVLFFAGTLRDVHARDIRIGMYSVALAACLIGLTYIWQLPLALR